MGSAVVKGDSKALAARRRLAAVLKDYGIDSLENQALHSWRCVPPYDRTHPCRHFDALLDDLVAAVVREEES